MEPSTVPVSATMESAKNWAYSIFGKELELDRILIQNSPIRKTRVWFIGDTGNGKTTTVGKLSVNSQIKGKDGFSHDTKRISEYDLNYVHKRTNDDGNHETLIYSLVLVDTRGTSDIGVDVHYSAKDLFIDMRAYYSFAEASKVVFVIMNRRLQPGQLKMIRDLYQAFGSKFLILITGTMDDDERSRTELSKLLKANGIPYKGTIMAVDWFHHEDDNDVKKHQKIVCHRRSKILDAIETLETVNVRSLSRSGKVVQFLNNVESHCLEVLRIPHAVDGILFVLAVGSLVFGSRRLLKSTSR